MKKIMLILIAVVLVCSVLLSACADSDDRCNSYTIATPYAYPVTPDMDEWNSLSIDEKMSLSYVDENIVKNMTTEAVLITTLNYPFIVNIFAYGKAERGIDVVKGYCSALAELLEREDAPQVISSYLEKTADTESIEYFVANNLWEYINVSVSA